ncbi:MAG: hypothetical protein IJU98_07605 [Synergistaceae bacterium]|nr:hypothetical protein [Synergistaceae bacterium]
MAVQAIAKSCKARVILNAGTNPSTGKPITKNLYMSKLASNPDGTKIYNVVDLAAPCLLHPVSGVETTEVKTLEKV